jgi:hypothetical protein
MSQQKINSSSKTMFIFPATENESKLVIKNPVGKLSASYDGIPVYVII